MPTGALVVLATYAVQCAEALLLAVLLGAFHTAYRRPYLKLWSRAWWAFCVYFLGGAAGLYAAALQLASDHPVRLALSTVALVASYWAALWLLLGTWEVAAGRGVDRRAEVALLVALGAVGIASALAWAFDPQAAMLRFFVRVGIQSLAAGLAFVLAGGWVWRSRRRGALGAAVVAVAFVLYGLEQLHYFAVAGWQLVRDAFAAYPPYLGFVDFFLQMVIGLGMVVWLLEEERARVLEASERIDYLSSHDSLTGLPNRQVLMRGLDMTLERARTDGSAVALVVLDVDRFQVVNSSLGHGFGDELLRSLGQRIAMALEPGTSIARLGEDEFAVVLTEAAAVADRQAILERVLRVVRRPFRLHRQEVYLTVSGGLALYPRDGDSAAELLRNAEAALHAMRADDRDGIREYAAHMNERALDRLDLEIALRHAVERDELRVHYQPIVRTGTCEVVAVEALVRWQHPDRGLLAPAEFLSLADGIGLLDELERWVLATACRQVRQWHDRGLPPVRVSVNISAGHMQRGNIVEDVRRALDASGLGPGRLLLEITENAAMEQAEVTLEILRELSGAGVGIAIDDFGTGYSSLSYLSAFPVSLLKLDRSFVRNLAAGSEDTAIAAAVIALAHGLRIPVVAEGVETEQQRLQLERHGCDYLQGYLFSPALDPARCVRLLAEAARSEEAQ